MICLLAQGLVRRLAYYLEEQGFDDCERFFRMMLLVIDPSVDTKVLHYGGIESCLVITDYHMTAT